MPDDTGSDTSHEKPGAPGARPHAPPDTVVQDGFPLLARDPGAVAPPGYELLAEVGRGGMGVVYRARDLALNRDVAVKILQDRFPADGPAARQFIEEAQITGQLVHPGVPPIHQIGTLPDGRPFLVMKLIRGNTLDVLLDEPHDRARLLAIFEHLCGTVGYAHARGVIHRDLKPSNVMVGAFGEVQVMDWGLAKVLRSAEGEPREERIATGASSTPHSEVRVAHSDDTLAGSVMGTLGYMSPEQAGGELAKIDCRSDVFALGSVLCVILAARPAYTARDPAELHLKAVRGETAEAFAALGACGAGAELVALCKRCLSTNPEQRPKDADEVAKAVAAVRTATEDRARQAELDRARAAERARLSPTVPSHLTRRTAMFGVPMVAVAAVGGYFAFRTRDGTPPDVVPPPVVPPPVVPPAVLVPVREVGGDVASVAVSDDGRWLAVAFLREDPAHGGVKLFDRSLGAAPEVWWKWRDTECRGAAFSPDGKLLAVAAGGRIRVWNFAEQKEPELAGATFSGTARAVAFSPDGKYLALALDQSDTEDRTPRPGLVRVWDMEKGSNPRDFVRLNYPVRSVAFAGDSAALAAGMSGRPGDWVPALEVWNAVTGGNVKALVASNAVIGPLVAFARTAPVCAVTDRDGVKLYRLPSFAPHEHEFVSDGAGEPTALALRADGTVAALALGGVVVLWEVARGAEYARLEKHKDGISSLAFTLDGRTLISGGPDRTVREWTVPAPPK